ncbi:hypothetical protein HYC85_020554 [Camellia sinensis]|uniref:DRBM domain-containing protein n=1 Tax=Camellia sinensis TaxID=4442 RepID=A0A7J7GQ41_CAMSI|nr:hypothetical protein HYC85_020554 [Camellia sinensis]
MFSLILLDPPELVMYKNRLQEYTQKSSIPLPVYEAINEGGIPHEPRFRSTVRVDGASYTSHDVFSQRKAAEQDVARGALDGITQKILIREEQGRDERSPEVQSTATEDVGRAPTQRHEASMSSSHVIDTWHYVSRKCHVAAMTWVQSSPRGRPILRNSQCTRTLCKSTLKNHPFHSQFMKQLMKEEFHMSQGLGPLSGFRYYLIGIFVIHFFSIPPVLNSPMGRQPTKSRMASTMVDNWLARNVDKPPLLTLEEKPSKG